MDLKSIRVDWETWGIAAVVTAAVVAGLVFKGLSGETIADAVKDVGQAMVPIGAAVVAARLVTREMDPSKRFQQSGERALESVQRKHRAILSGPSGSREKYDPENPGKAGRYLFVRRNGKGRKAQLVSVVPLAEGIVEVRVSKTTLLVLGESRDSVEQARQAVKRRVGDEVKHMLEDRWRGTFELLDHSHPDIAVALDFDERSMGYRRFAKAVADCAETATSVLETVGQV
ncbi:MAG: hypothetical protein GY851_22920 [bacterium]|nr:hypothetical protein [bacterium]